MVISTYDLAGGRNLGLHHVAYLRAIAEGVDRTVCARLYLDARDAAQARDAHQEIIDAARAIARRSAAGRSSWRLLGVLVSAKKPSQAPTLEQYVEQRNLNDWDEAQCMAWYLEDYPQPADSARRSRLLSRQMDLIRVLETTAAQPPDADDPIECWYDELTTQRLAAAGMRTLGELLQKVKLSSTWYADVPAIGEEKAHRIAAQANRLVPNFDYSPAPVSPSAFNQPSVANAALIDRWTASGVAASTAKKYKREATRLALWLEIERGEGAEIVSMRPEECAAYVNFLKRIPRQWLSERQARIGPFSPGWAPFRVQPSEDAQAESIAALTTFFSWLRQTGEIKTSPWAPHCEVSASATTAGRPRSGVNPFQSKMGALRTNVARARASLETAMLGLICCLLDTGEVSAQALTKLRIADVAADASTVRVGKRLVSLTSGASELLEESLRWRAVSYSSAEAAYPLLCNPRFPDRPLSYRALLTLIEKWTNTEGSFD